MDLGLKGRVAVITGGGTGIGRAAAEAFLREGVQVAVIGRREEPLAEFAREMREQGFDPYYESCDVADRAQVEAFAEHLYARFGRLDIWVNNAGIAINKKFMDFTDEDFDSIVSINMKAVFHCTQVAASYMKKQGKGVILNATSFNSKIAHANGILYAATKAAVSSMTKSTAAALGPYGIRVLGYLPGMIVTPISEQMVSQYREKFTKDIALGRLGRPEDLAGPLVFLASDAASYMSGTDIEITGGKYTAQDCSMAWRFREEELAEEEAAAESTREADR